MVFMAVRLFTSTGGTLLIRTGLRVVKKMKWFQNHRIDEVTPVMQYKND